MIDHFLHKVCVTVTILLLLAAGQAWAQTGPPAGAPAGTGDKVDLIHADSLNVVNQPNAVVYRLIRNVKLQQKGVVLYCDLAIQNKTTNVIEAYGHVRMVQGDTIDVRGDTLYYYGNTRQANVLGHVVLKDRKMTLNTARLDYDMLSGLAHYPVKGRIVDRENTLTSEEGDYYTGNKQFVFKRNVRLLNQPPGKEKTTILGDSLLYNSRSKIADFQGPTRIISKDGTLVARNGQYNTITRMSNFRQRATAETDKYTLTGDTLDFDNVNEVGVAHGNVVIVNKADKTTLTGDHGRYNGKAGVSRMIGHAVVRSPISQGPDLDTLYMRADTLFSFDNKLTKKKKLVGQKNVLVFKSDLQSKCDSLVYDVNDSLLYFYKKPIVWSQNYQMEADSITARLKNNRINTMFLKTRAFVISRDTLLNFNQVKGRQITAYFRTILAQAPKKARPAGPMTASAANRPGSTPLVTPAVATTAGVEKTTLDRVLVEGNGQTIYFAVDEKNRLVGMNRTECSKMNIEFVDSRVTRIRNYGRPDMYLTPPKELTEEKKQLAGFRWREKEKPTRAQTLGLTPLETPGPVTSASPIAALRDKISGAAPAVAAAATSLSVTQKTLVTAAAIAGKVPASQMSAIARTITPEMTNAIGTLPASVTAATSQVVAKLATPATAEKVKVAVNAAARQPVPTSASEAVATIRRIGDEVEATPQPARAPLLNRPVSPLTTRGVKPLTTNRPALPDISRPVVSQSTAGTVSVTDKQIQPADAPIVSAVTEPVIDKPVPLATSVRKSADSVETSPVAKPVVAKSIVPVTVGPVRKVVVGKPKETSAKPVAVSSSSSTIPTRRAERQRKIVGQVAPAGSQKGDSVRTPVNESDLEKELNRKVRKP